MIHRNNRWISILMAVVLLLLCNGCGEPVQPTEPLPQMTEPTSAPTTVPTTAPVTVPTTAPTAPSSEPTLPTQIGSNGSLELTQLRRDGYQRDWIAMFRSMYGNALSVTDKAGLADAVSNLGVSLPREFNEPFFRDNYLVLIPMQSGSGSVRYEGDASVESGTVIISLYGKLDGVGTADMADWLVLVTMPRDLYNPKWDIRVNTDNHGNNNSDLNISDR